MKTESLIKFADFHIFRAFFLISSKDIDSFIKFRTVLDEKITYDEKITGQIPSLCVVAEKFRQPLFLRPLRTIVASEHSVQKRKP